MSLLIKYNSFLLEVYKSSEIPAILNVNVYRSKTQNAGVSSAYEQGAGNREQEVGFTILNEVTHSVLRKNLNLCQQEPNRLRWYRRPLRPIRDGMAAIPYATFETAWQPSPTLRFHSHKINTFFHIENYRTSSQWQNPLWFLLVFTMV